MNSGDTPDQRLSQLATPWTAMGQAQTPNGNPEEAQALVLERYRPAVTKYLQKLARNADAAEELVQEFALRFLRGDFRQVRPERGRFRDYVKAALRNLVTDYYRKCGVAPGTLPPASQLAGGESLADNEFNDIWKKDLIMRAWAALRADAESNGRLNYEALRLKADDPMRQAEDVAKLLSEQHRKSFTAAAVRQLQHRAREQFAGFLRDAVRASLPHGNAQDVDEELADLGLLAYVKPQN
jgi:RNA polymerase sigma-70 factor (ECF subfamily)